MEPDRFNQSNVLFIICLLSLVISLCLFGTAFYILPYLIWGWNYNVPDFTVALSEWFKENYSYSQAAANGLVFLVFIIPALITGGISYITSNRIENKVLGLTEEKPPEEENVAPHELKESVGFGLKIVVMIVLVIIAVLIFEWLITVPASQQEFV